MKFISKCLLAVLFYASSAMADVHLPALFTDHMILQRDMPVPVWGTADAGESVTVSIADQKATATADEKGKWLLKVGPLRVSADPQTLTVTGKNTVKFADVLVGDVWLAAGQSNMTFTLGECVNGAKEVAAADYPQMRLFFVARGKALEPLADTKGAWRGCSPQSTRSFSGVAYFFGRELHQDLKVPIGLIDAAGWGCGANAYVSREALAADPYLNIIIRNWDNQLKGFPKQQDDYRQKLSAWQKEADAAKAVGKPEPANKPQPPQEPLQNWSTTSMFNAQIAPLIPFGIRGVIWYQGENNTGLGYQYRKLFPLLINDWRKRWGQGDFPFLYVLLANYGGGGRPAEPKGSDGAELCEAQVMALALPNTGLASAKDLGEPRDIHPKNKQDVGHRLALTARARVYGENIEYSGPMFESMQVEGSKVRLKFTHIGGGLVARGDLDNFEIAGADQKFHWATAAIDGETIVVGSDVVAAPAAVRYAWSGSACTLYNKAGLPAPTFRTDDWKGISADKNW